MILTKKRRQKGASFSLGEIDFGIANFAGSFHGLGLVVGRPIFDGLKRRADRLSLPGEEADRGDRHLVFGLRPQAILVILDRVGNRVSVELGPDIFFDIRFGAAFALFTERDPVTLGILAVLRLLEAESAAVLGGVGDLDLRAIFPNGDRVRVDPRVGIQVAVGMPRRGDDELKGNKRLGRQVGDLQVNPPAAVNLDDVELGVLEPPLGVLPVRLLEHLQVTERSRPEGAEAILPGGSRIADRVVRVAGEVDHLGELLEESVQIARPPVGLMAADGRAAVEPLRLAVGVARLRAGDRIVLEEKDRLFGIVGDGLFELLMDPVDLLGEHPVIKTGIGGREGDEVIAADHLMRADRRAEDLLPMLARTGEIAVVGDRQNPLGLGGEPPIHRVAEGETLGVGAGVGHVAVDGERVEARIPVRGTVAADPVDHLGEAPLLNHLGIAGKIVRLGRPGEVDVGGDRKAEDHLVIVGDRLVRRAAAEHQKR